MSDEPCKCGQCGGAGNLPARQWVSGVNGWHSEDRCEVLQAQVFENKLRAMRGKRPLRIGEVEQEAA